MKQLIKNFIYRLRGDHTTESLIKEGLVVGKNFNRLIGTILDPSHCFLITIGDDVTMAPNVHILAHDASTCAPLGYCKIGRVTIGNNVFIGASTVVLPNVTIGDNTIIGANAVVSKSLEGGYVYAGNPARAICTYDEYVAKNKALMENRPVYDEKYTMRNNKFTKEMKKEMFDSLSDGIGFVE